MKTLLLPTTVGVNEAISIKESLEILKLNGVTFEVAGDVIDGMYVADNGEIVAEQLLPISSNINASSLAMLFTQECILSSDETTAQLVAQNGDVWARFDKKVEYILNDYKEIIALQEKMARHFGGSSRVGNRVWAWGNDENISSWAI